MRVCAAVVCILVAGSSAIPAQQASVLAAPRVGALPIPTQMHGSAIIGQRLYIFGGDNTSGWTDNVISASVGSDGKVGEWRTERALPVRLAYLNNCVEVVGNRIYIVGGIVAPAADTPEKEAERSSDVFWTASNPDGTLEPWRKSPPFPGPNLGFMATCSTDRHLFVTGGSTREDVSAKAYAAEFSATGEPANWREIGLLPSPLWQHGAAILDGRLYVWGGVISRKDSSHISTKPAPINSASWSAEIRLDATLGTWREEAAMERPTFAAATAGFNDYLVAVGGRYTNKSPTNDIGFSRLDSGVSRQWGLESTDLDARVYHSLGLDRGRGWIFISGGQDKKKSGSTPVSRVDTIQAFRIPQPETARLRTEEIAARPSGAAAAGAPAGTPGFASLDEALRTAALQKKRILVFFSSQEVPECRRFFDSVVKSAEFQALGREYILAVVDVSGDQAPLGPKYSIYKVPGLAVLGPDGKLEKSNITARTIEDVSRFLSPR